MAPFRGGPARSAARLRLHSAYSLLPPEPRQVPRQPNPRYPEKFPLNGKLQKERYTPRICIGRGLAAIRPTKNRLLTSYAFYILRSMEAEIIGNTGATFASINKGDIRKRQIPLPPLEVQKEIVAEIEGYQKVIDGARAVVGNYRPHIEIDPDWPMATLKDYFTTTSGGTPSKATPSFWAGTVPWVSLELPLHRLKAVDSTCD